MNSRPPRDCADEVATLLKKQLSVGGTGLDGKLRRGGRLLPRHVRKDAEFLASAAAASQNPKLQRFVDSGRVEKSYENCLKHLKGIDKSKRRTDVFLSVLSGVALGILIPAALFTTVLVWRGYL
ncbi:hypothetical protein AB9F29_06070 [Falsihalocynthiibacter sp. S25ZX9]|uniref:hypothetical protein n=1 Tax=Falsihalocynthiibacter sp. S25ZX9 TaxID=3240870 RepID=UPI00351090E5